MTQELILMILKIVIGALLSGLITIITAFLKTEKGKRLALKAKEFAEKTLTMDDYAKDLIVQKEAEFELQDKILKERDPKLSVGSLKKESVLNALFQKAIEIGLSWSKDTWSAKIDDLVAMTRNVNQRDKDKPSEQVNTILIK
jgi:hypothetical protein